MGTVSGTWEGQCEETGRRRERYLEEHTQAGANAWRAVEGGGGSPADLKKTKRQGHEHLCDTGLSVGNGNLGNDRTTITKATSLQKQLGTKNSKSKDDRQDQNGVVKGRDRSAEELDREPGEAQTTLDRIR